MSKLIFRNERHSREYRRKNSRLYRLAFPAEERMPLWMLRMLAARRDADFYSVYHGAEYVGLCYLVRCQNIVYLFYLAVDEHVRDKGYGSKILKAVQKRYQDCRIILNIEVPDPRSENNEQRLKRKAFYEKNGFVDLHYTVKEAKVIYEMFCFDRAGRYVSKEEYFMLMRHYLGDVLYEQLYRRISQ